MYRHMRSKVLFDDEEIRDIVAHESGNVLDFKNDPGHAPTDLTYLVDNDLDKEVSVQIIGGARNAAGDAWLFKTNVGDPTVIAADTKATIDVFPGEHYHPAYDVEVTASVQPTEDGITVRAEYVIDQ